MSVFTHHPQPIVGTSGALLYVTDHVTVKVAPQRARVAVRERINAQAAWMIERHCEVLPKIHAKWNGGYAMETLKPLTIGPSYDPKWHIELTRKKLQRHVWGLPSVVSGRVLLGHHATYVANLLADWAPHLAPKMMGWMKGVSKLDLSQVVAHGDPTVDNLMLRQNGDHVITDPIPASPRMPALLAVDVGKLLQSGYGYEVIRAGHETDYSYAESFDAATFDLHPYDVTASKYFLAVHLLRLIPYQKLHRDKFLVRLEALVARGIDAL
jgi:hypothetical protein